MAFNFPLKNKAPDVLFLHLKLLVFSLPFRAAGNAVLNTLEVGSVAGQSE